MVTAGSWRQSLNAHSVPFHITPNRRLPKASVTILFCPLGLPKAVHPIGRKTFQTPQRGQSGQKPLIRICIEKQPKQALSFAFPWIQICPYFFTPSPLGQPQSAQGTSVTGMKSRDTRSPTPTFVFLPRFVLLAILGLRSPP